MLNISSSRSELILSCQTIISIKNRLNDRDKNELDTLDTLFTELCPAQGNPGVWLICYHLIRQLAGAYLPNNRSLYDISTDLTKRQLNLVLNKAIKILNWNIDQRDQS